MLQKYLKLPLSILLFLFLSINLSLAEIIKSIEIKGNKRIPKETIIMFADISKGQDINNINLNTILKNIYESNFFENVSVNYLNNSIFIEVVELPIIENITYQGVKAQKIKDKLFKDLLLKPRSSYNKLFLESDKKNIESSLKELGYYFSKVEISVTELEDNKIDLTYDVDLGKKSKIKKISFVGNKIFKDRKLKRIITSEEYKFWKFISGSKFLNENLISFDMRLLNNFYLNKGYYNVQINSSFARLINEDEFELIFNINANEKFVFDNIVLNLPIDFEKSNFDSLNDLFEDLKGQNYSINKVEKILEEIDKVTLEEQYESISANVQENIIGNKINLEFIIEKSEKLFVEKINIFGNNVTRENVIRNQFEIDEGDPYNEILAKKSLNNLKNLRFFKDVDSEIVQGSSNDARIINITVEEKPTGEIAAGAGFGTDGGTVLFSVKENNYLGKGLQVEAKALINEESIKGNFSVTNPNFNNTDKSVYFSAQTSETDRLTDFGYKTNKTGFLVGTNFEFLDDMILGLGTSNYYEKIETASNASARQKTQAGNYWDSFLNFNFDYDKRNQSFQTTEGFRSRYFVDFPVLSETNSLSNTYNYQYFTDLYEDNVSIFSVYLRSVESLTNDDVKLSERIFLPTNKLRGFETGKVGPKDGDDFIGGNYATAINFSSTIPQILENSQNIDVLFFIDAANVWGVDYDTSIDDNSKIRSSIGLGLDWLTPIGPVNFTFAETLSKADTDITESFRFNLGTTF